ncbi:MAG TPA: hypothetical protein PLK75_04380 [Bacteroidales bacterium]|nr:hypothetical protein [Bacteroidales bacterium]
MALSCHDKPHYEREKELISYLKTKHPEVLQQDRCGLLVYRKPYRCDLFFDAGLVNDINNVLYSQKPEKLYVIYDFETTKDSLETNINFENKVYFREDYNCLDRYGFRLAPMFFIIKNGRIDYWHTITKGCD